MNTAQIIETESRYTSGVYSKRPVAIVRGEGARVWDSDGKEYIDCVGGQGSANVGHANPAVVRDAVVYETRRVRGPEELQLPLADDVFLPNIFIQCARTHTRRERCFLFHAFPHGMVKKIVTHGVIIMSLLLQKENR